MPGIRDRIRMDEAELARFLREERTVTCATIGRDGLPHLMPLWYMLHADVTIHRDHDTVLALGMELLLRYGGDSDEAGRRGVLSQTPKRVALEFRVRRVVSWDHRKFSVRGGASS